MIIDNDLNSAPFQYPTVQFSILGWYVIILEEPKAISGVLEKIYVAHL